MRQLAHFASFLTWWCDSLILRRYWALHAYWLPIYAYCREYLLRLDLQFLNMSLVRLCTLVEMCNAHLFKNASTARMISIILTQLNLGMPMTFRRCTPRKIIRHAKHGSNRRYLYSNDFDWDFKYSLYLLLPKYLNSTYRNVHASIMQFTSQLPKIFYRL
jgi:hypothetical protein